MANENFIQAEEVIGSINERFKQQIEVVNKLITSVKNLENAYKTPSAYLNAQRELADVVMANEKAQQELQKTIIATEKAKQAAARATLAELAAERELERGIQQSNNTKKSAIALEMAEQRQREATARATKGQQDAYGQLSAELNKSFRATASLAAEMYLLKEAGDSASDEYKQLNAEFEQMRIRTLKLDTALKGIDSSLGRNQRNVGNYKFDALGNSIQQILREAPSAAVSLNTFFLAISNNLPMFFDAFAQVKNDLSELKDAAQAAAAQLVENQTAQAAANAVAQEAQETLSGQVETIISSVQASHEQAVAIREQIAAHLTEAETTGVATAETIANTSATLTNAGATIEQVAAIEADIVAQAEATAAAARATTATNAQTVAVTEANAALAAQPSLLNRLGSSLFSVGTALTVGVTLLTLYGGAIIDWTAGLMGASDALDKIAENQEKINNSQKTGLKATVDARTQLKENLAIAKDAALTDTEREIALKKLRAQYPLYFKNLTDQQIYAGKTVKAEEEIIDALNKRAAADEAASVISENDKKLIDLQAELKANRDINKEKQKEISRLKNQRNQALDYELRNALSTKIANKESEIGSNLGRNKEILEEINALNAQNSNIQDDILQKRKESIGLDFREEKPQKQKEKHYKDNIDYEASLYELRVLNSEQLIAYEERIMNDVEVNYDKRLAAAQEYYMEQGNLLALQEQQETSAENFRYKQLKAEYEESIKEGTATNAQLEQIELQHTYNLDKINADYRGRNFDLTVESAKKLKDVLAGIELQANNNEIDELALQEYYALQQELSATNVNTSYKEFKDLEKRKEDLQTNTAKRRNELQIKETERQITQLKASQKITDTEATRNNQNQKLNELNGTLIGLKREASELDEKAIQDAAALALELKRTTDQYLQGFSNGFLQDAGLDVFTDIFQKGEDGLTNFERRMAGAGTDLTKQFQVAFETVSTLAEQTFAFINQASQNRFQQEYDGLQRQKDAQLRFAGESQAAQEEINRQYEEKRREIRLRELKAQKDQATFNAIINTAQAVVAALPNIPLSVTIGAIGAAQIAFIRAQQLPAFAEGGITEKDGKILVNDAKGSNYREVVVTPDGKIYKPQGRNRVMNMPKGTEIFKDYSTFNKQMNDMLSSNNIAPGYNYNVPVMPNIQQSGNANIGAEIKNAFKSLNPSTFNLSYDKNGFDFRMSKAHTDQEFRNNSLSCRGRIIK